MKLIIVRHGETVENRNEIMQGHMPGTLTKEGIKQAEKAALRLKDEIIDVIYSSDLARAADTAKIIAKFHENTPFIFSKRLREYNLGPLEGKKRMKIDWKNNPPKGTEPNGDADKRIMSMVDEAYEKTPKGTVLFVSHGGISSALIKLLTKKTEIEKLKNTSITIFEIKEDNNHKLILFNCTDHLK